MPVATRRATLYRAILEFEKATGGYYYALNDENWNLLRENWEDKSKPHTLIFQHHYEKWKYDTFSPLLEVGKYNNAAKSLDLLSDVQMERHYRLTRCRWTRTRTN